MTTHSSVLAWEIPWTEEPGGLQSIGLEKIRHNNNKEGVEISKTSTYLYLELCSSLNLHVKCELWSNTQERNSKKEKHTGSWHTASKSDSKMRLGLENSITNKSLDAANSADQEPHFCKRSLCQTSPPAVCLLHFCLSQAHYSVHNCQYSESPTHESSKVQSWELSKMIMCLCASNHMLVHAFDIHRHMCTSSTTGAFVYFTVPYRVQ